MNILLMTSHSIAEYDDLRMFSDLGYDVFSIGAYTNPHNPTDGKRPALPNATYHEELAGRAQMSRNRHPDGPGDKIDWAKADLHSDIIDWADAIIVHHFPERWICDQWQHIGHKRVIWRTCGQSDPRLEAVMGQFHDVGMEIVRYSPAERRAFELVGSFAGQDALIRFGKYPDDYGPWIGDDIVVGNITQDMAHRGDATGYPFWLAATEGLPVKPAGPGSDAMAGGIGALEYPAMLEYLRHIRAYLYTGTRPASYTLGLIEAMMSGVPTVTMDAQTWADGWGGPGGPFLFEAPEIVRAYNANGPIGTQNHLRDLLDWDEDEALPSSQLARERAVELFDVAKVGQQWVDFLGAP